MFRDAQQRFEHAALISGILLGYGVTTSITWSAITLMIFIEIVYVYKIGMFPNILIVTHTVLTGTGLGLVPVCNSKQYIKTYSAVTIVKTKQTTKECYE